MSVTKTARVPTENGSRYMQQLCKHWSHKFETEFDASVARIELPACQAKMVAQADALVVTLTIEDPDTVDRMQEVIAEHLNRFAFREAPLPFDWQ